MFNLRFSRIFFLFPAMLSMLSSASALQYFSGSRVIIDRPVFDNIYITAGYITINAPVHGDVIIVGGRVVINDSVYNDLLVAGGEVEMRGFAGEDVRCAGGRIYIHRNVGGDVVLFGGEIETGNSVRIRNIYGRAGRLILNGQVSGDVQLNGGALTINAIIGGRTNCCAQSIIVNGSLEKGGFLAAPHISVGPSAWFGKELHFWNRTGKIITANPFVQTASVYDETLKIPGNHWYFLGFTNGFSMLIYLAMILALMSTIHAALPQTLRNAGTIAMQKPFRILLKGLLYLAGIPLLCILLITSVVGLPLGMVVLALYALLLLCSGIIFSLILTYGIREQQGRNWSVTRTTFIAMAFFTGLKLLQMIPVAGYILAALAGCFMAGALVSALVAKRIKL